MNADPIIESIENLAKLGHKFADERDRYKRKCERLSAALDECLDYFADREDVVDGDYGQPRANEAMRMAQMIREVLGLA